MSSLSHDSNLNILRFFFSFGGYRVLLSLPVQLQHTQTHAHTFLLLLLLFLLLLSLLAIFSYVFICYFPHRDLIDLTTLVQLVISLFRLNIYTFTLTSNKFLLCICFSFFFIFGAHENLLSTEKKQWRYRPWGKICRLMVRVAALSNKDDNTCDLRLGDSSTLKFWYFA